MSLLASNIFIFVLATVLAILEIQIEGENGWAKNLPTWRPKNQNFWVRLYVKAMSGKELTGYHLTMFAFVFLIFLFPFFFGLSVNLANIVEITSLYFIFVALWDFLWFVLNPHYPLKDFSKDNPNHKKWFLGIPSDYYFSLIVSFLIILGYSFFAGESGAISWWVQSVILFGVETLLLILFSLYILKIDHWKK